MGAKAETMSAFLGLECAIWAKCLIERKLATERFMLAIVTSGRDLLFGLSNRLPRVHLESGFAAENRSR